MLHYDEMFYDMLKIYILNLNNAQLRRNCIIVN